MNVGQLRDRHARIGRTLVRIEALHRARVKTEWQAYWAGRRIMKVQRRFRQMMHETFRAVLDRDA